MVPESIPEGGVLLRVRASLGDVDGEESLEACRFELPAVPQYSLILMLFFDAPSLLFFGMLDWLSSCCWRPRPVGFVSLPVDPLLGLLRVPLDAARGGSFATPEVLASTDGFLPVERFVRLDPPVDDPPLEESTDDLRTVPEGKSPVANREGTISSPELSRLELLVKSLTVSRFSTWLCGHMSGLLTLCRLIIGIRSFRGLPRRSPSLRL